MVKLTPSVVMGRVKQNNLDNLKKLNVWGCDIDDISLLESMTSLEILSLSVNRISTIRALAGLYNLRELYLRKNDIEDLSEVEHLRGCRKLRVLWLDDNPCAEQPDYRKTVLRNLPFLKTLDNRTVTREEIKDLDLVEDPYEEMEVHPPPPRPSSALSHHPPVAHVPPIGEVAFYTPVLPTSMTQSYHPSYSTAVPAVPLHHPTPHYAPYPSHPQHPLPQQDIMSQSVIGVLPTTASNTPRMDESWINFDEADEVQDQPTGLTESFSRFGLRRSVSSALRTRRSRSVSPNRAQRLDNVLTAVFHLLDELDADGLRAVIDECHERIKKQR